MDSMLRTLHTHILAPAKPWYLTLRDCENCNNVEAGGVKLYNWGLFFLMYAFSSFRFGILGLTVCSIIGVLPGVRMVVYIAWRIIRGASGKYGLLWLFAKPLEYSVGLIAWGTFQFPFSAPYAHATRHYLFCRTQRVLPQRKR